MMNNISEANKFSIDKEYYSDVENILLEEYWLLSWLIFNLDFII